MALGLTALGLTALGLTAVTIMEPQQISLFKRDGFVIVPKSQWLRDDTLESWRAQLWSSLTLARDDPASWPLGSPEIEVERNFGVYTEEAKRRIIYPWNGRATDGKGGGADMYPVRPAVGDLPSVKAICDQLIGHGNYGQGMVRPITVEPLQTGGSCSF